MRTQQQHAVAAESERDSAQSSCRIFEKQLAALQVRGEALLFTPPSFPPSRSSLPPPSLRHALHSPLLPSVTLFTSPSFPPSRSSLPPPFFSRALPLPPPTFPHFTTCLLLLCALQHMRIIPASPFVGPKAQLEWSPKAQLVLVPASFVG